MVFSNKVRFPGSWEKEAAPDFVGVAKITVPETADPSAPSAVTCKWPRLTSPSCMYRPRCELCPTTAKGGTRSETERERERLEPRRGCGDGYEVRRQKVTTVRWNCRPFRGAERKSSSKPFRGGNFLRSFHDLYVLFRHRFNSFNSLGREQDVRCRWDSSPDLR